MKSLDEETTFTRMFLNEDVLCNSCRSKWIEHKKVYNIDGINYHVLYEYDDNMESFFFRYKEQRDIVLASAFLCLYRDKFRKTMKRYKVCGVCSSDEKYHQRGFLPLEEIFNSLDIRIYFPLYKQTDFKQSKHSKKERVQIEKVIQRKNMYPISLENILLVDDVLTTGATLHRACELLKPSSVFVIAAHSLWIKENKPNEQVEKMHTFW